MLVPWRRHTSEVLSFNSEVAVLCEATAAGARAGLIWQVNIERRMAAGRMEDLSIDISSLEFKKPPRSSLLMKRLRR